MKQGKWNYTEDIEYDVILVRLHEAKEPKTHWQNAFAGQERQVVRVAYEDKFGKQKRFFIDNQDGSGLRKIDRGGSPDSYHASIDGFDLIRELPESEWQRWDPALHQKSQADADEWMKKNYPEDYEQMLSLRSYIQAIQKKQFKQ